MNVYPSYELTTEFDDESRDFWVKVNGENAFVHRVFVDMHHVQPSSAVMFDVNGETEVEITYPVKFACNYKIRPASTGIKYEQNGPTIKFTINKPVNLSIEINDDIIHNLHLFAQKPIPCPDGVKFNPGIHGDELAIENGCAILLPGVHFVSGCSLKMKNNSSLYICGGAVLIGSIDCINVDNIKIYGNGMINLHQYPRFSCFHAINVERSTNVTVEGITIVDPPHYSIGVGASRELKIKDIKCFSCVGWSDGIDIMCSENIDIDGVFMRNSDDCIAIYGSRWDFYGSSRNISVKNSILWADVAHPTMIGCHGDYANGGDIIENISFENIDVLNHHEPQDNYTGVFAVNVGDGNIARNISYKNIRVEQYQRGRLVDLRVFKNADYNPIPGRAIHDITFEDISYSGYGEMESRISGYDSARKVYNVTFKNVTEHGRSISENINIGDFTENITFE